MGSLLSTPGNSAPGAQADHQSSSSWVTFPPKSGVLFAGHFYLGGDKFDSVARESFIFGEPAELHYLNSRPVPYPLPVGKPACVSRPLRALLGVRKESVRFVKADSQRQTFHVELVLDCLVDCEAAVYLFARQSFTGQRLALTPQHPLHLSPERRRFQRGLGQVFSCSELALRPALFDADAADWQADLPGGGGGSDTVFPVAVLCEALGEGPANQQLLLCTAERQASDGSYSLKLLKQIMVIDGLPLVTHDLYGITDREVATSVAAANAAAAGDADPAEADCVVCMVKPRDTVILPCRHLCLCDTCADSLRYQASCCPICRAPFRALLQLSVLRPVSSGPASAGDAAAAVDEAAGGGGGYHTVPILEFVDTQRQQQSTVASSSSSSSAAAAAAAASASARGRPATAQAWASPVKPARQVPQQQQPPPRRRISSEDDDDDRDDHRGNAESDDDEEDEDDDDCWADSESDGPGAAAAAATAGGGAGAVAFPMAVLDHGGGGSGSATLLLVDGDVDRASCSASTESANSQRQLLAPSLPAAAASAAAAAAAASAAGGGGGGGDGTLDSDDDESDFSVDEQRPAV